MGRNEPSTGEEYGKVVFPTRDPRQEVLENVGQNLGLRLLDVRKSKDSMLINCRNEEVQKQALELEGLELADPDERIVGKLSVQSIRSTSLTLPEIMKLVDAFVWEVYELGKIAPKEEHQEKEENSRTRVVETTTSPPKTPNSTPPWASRAGKSGKGKREQSPDQGRRSTPPSSPTGGGDLQVPPTESVMLAKGLAKLATTPIGMCNLARKSQ